MNLAPNAITMTAEARAEIFDSVAIVLGAYAWRRQPGNIGLYVVILGIACMLIGLYFIAFVIGNFFP